MNGHTEHGEPAADYAHGQCGFGQGSTQCPHPATTHLMITTPCYLLGIGSCDAHLANIRTRIHDRHPYLRTCAVRNHAWHNSGHNTSWCGPAWSGP